MDSSKLPEVKPQLSITPARIEIVLADDPSSPLAFVSPPIDDINEMVDLKQAAFSLRDHVAKSEDIKTQATYRLAELSSKARRFSGSPTFHNRLSNLFFAAGQPDHGERESELALQLQESPFLARKVGEARARRGDIEGAKSLFLRTSSTDPYAALRLASFSVLEGDLDQAEDWVKKALGTNPAGYAERLFQGALYLVRREFSEAIVALRIALDDRPASSVGHANLGLAYLGLQRPDKAFRCLKKAVALDPFNRSALVALADTAAALGKDEDVINSLRYYVQFEQKEPAVWGRLARSLLRLDLFDDCVHALKRQGALEASMSVWNNLGVAYAKQKQFSASLKAFTHALTLEPEGGFRQQVLALRNLSALFVSHDQFKRVVDLVKPVLDKDTDGDISRDEAISEIYSTYIGALARIGKQKEALDLSDRLLEIDGLSGSLARWIVIFQSATYGLERTDDEKLAALLDGYASRLIPDSKGDLRFINNVAFGLAELGRLKEAKNWLNKGSWAIHKDPYATATLGLINVRDGNLERGEALYREAIALAIASSDKARIRQKMNVEIGRAFSVSDKARSLKLLSKALAEGKGEEALRRQAAQAIKALKRLPE